MSQMLANKIAGAVLLVALVLVAISTIGNALVHPRDSGTGEVAVAALATPEPETEAPGEAAPQVPLASLLAEADTARRA